MSGLLAIPIIFNTYTSLLGTHYLALDILTFILGVIITFLVSYYLLKFPSIEFNTIGFLILVVMMILFFIFTFAPPKLDIFLDPVTLTYGT